MIFRESFPLLPEWTQLAMYVILIPFALIFCYGLWKVIREFELDKALYQLSMKDLKKGLARVFSQKRVIERLRGVPHLLLFIGTFILFLGTLTIFLETDILSYFGIRILFDGTYSTYELLMDISGIMLLIGIVTFFPTRDSEGKALLLGLLYIGVTGFLLESTRVYAHPNAASHYSFVGSLLSGIVGPYILPFYPWIWWSHALTAFGMVAYLPYSNLLHSLTAVITSSLGSDLIEFPKEPFLLEELENLEEINLGFKDAQELPWYEKYALAACVKCGRCTEVCPAHAIERPLSPKEVVSGLKQAVLGKEYDLGDETVWSCVSCGACSAVCPNYISPFSYLMERRRFLVAEGRIDKKMKELLNGLRRYHNALSVPQRGRLSWLESDEDPDYYIWVGCQYSFDPVGRRIVGRLVELLRGAGVRIATFGEMETCCGEPARRLGEEGMFQEFALSNAELFKELGVKKLLVLCPHGLTVFKREYPRVVKDWDIEVISHVELLSRLVREGKLRVENKEKDEITFHDPCNLARFNGVVEEPREILRQIDGFREMPRHGKDTFCCGGGGANYWYQTGESAMAKERIMEAINSGAEEIVVACPFCYAMLSDAVKGLNLKNFEVKEITEVLEREGDE